MGGILLLVLVTASRAGAESRDPADVAWNVVSGASGLGGPSLFPASAGTMGVQALDAASPERARGEPDQAPDPGPIRRAKNAPPWPKDFETGLEAARSVAFQYGLVENDSLQKRVNRIGYLVASQTERPDILFTFHIIDMPDPNAFSLPGGFVFITKGMLSLGLSDPILAELIGHELGHVTQGHFAREGRINTALSLIQTAMTLAALIAVPTSSSGGYDIDRETGQYRLSLAGKDAAVQGSEVFGGLFRELLLRSYSRGFEAEADEAGRHFAARAGFPVSASLDLMELLHSRIYEDEEYGYWRTHPYFSEREEAARAAVAAGGTPPDSLEIHTYRENVAQRLSVIATSIEDEPTSLFVYRSALEASPDGQPSYEIEHRLLAMRADRLRTRKPLMRSYGPLIADYDSLLTRARSASITDLTENWVQKVQGERDDLDHERKNLHPAFIAAIDHKLAGATLLEIFLQNYPSDPRAQEARFRLADLYRLSDRPDASALILEEIENPAPRRGFSEENLASGSSRLAPGYPLPASDPAAPPPPPADVARALGMLRGVLPLTKDLTTNQRLVLSTRSDSVRTWAVSRLRAQASGLDSLEVGSKFLEEYPVSIVSDQVRDKVEELAMKRYYRARLQESLTDFQGALDTYNQVILLAPHTRAAGLCREGVSRIQTLSAG